MLVSPHPTLLVVLHGAHPSMGGRLDHAVQTLPAAGVVVERLGFTELELANNADAVLDRVAALVNSNRPLRRVAFLLLASGFGDEELGALASRQGMASYPILLQSLGHPTPKIPAQHAEAAVEQALTYLRLHPEFSVEAGGQADARPAQAPAAAPRVLPAATAGGVLRKKACASNAVAKRWWAGERAERIVPTQEDGAGSAVLLTVVSMDGVGASRTLRRRQREVMQDIAGRLEHSAEAAWVVSSFHAGAGLERVSGPEAIGAFSPRKIGSREAEEIQLDRLAREILIEMRLDAGALERRGWRVAGRCLLILAPGFPYLGVGRNSQLENLVSEVDLCSWVGTVTGDGAQPPALGLAGVWVSPMHADSAREIGDALAAVAPTPPEPSLATFEPATEAGPGPGPAVTGEGPGAG